MTFSPGMLGRECGGGCRSEGLETLLYSEVPDTLLTYILLVDPEPLESNLVFYLALHLNGMFSQLHHLELQIKFHKVI